MRDVRSIISVTGRASRREFLTTNLTMVVIQALGLVFLVLFGISETEDVALKAVASTGLKLGTAETTKVLEFLNRIQWQFSALMILTLLPLIAVSARRLNDLGKSTLDLGFYFFPSFLLWFVFHPAFGTPSTSFLTLMWVVNSFWFWITWLSVCAWYYIELGCFPGRGWDEPMSNLGSGSKTISSARGSGSMARPTFGKVDALKSNA